MSVEAEKNLIEVVFYKYLKIKIINDREKNWEEKNA